MRELATTGVLHERVERMFDDAVGLLALRRGSVSPHEAEPGIQD